MQSIYTLELSLAPGTLGHYFPLVLTFRAFTTTERRAPSLEILFVTLPERSRAFPLTKF